MVIELSSFCQDLITWPPGRLAAWPPGRLAAWPPDRLLLL